MVNKAEQIAQLRSTPHRQKMLKIFNYLREIFNGPTGEKSTLQGEGLKILTPNQMLRRLPISLAQLKAGNNSEKQKLGNYFVLCTDQKNLQKMSIIIRSTLFKNGNNLYEH